MSVAEASFKVCLEEWAVSPALSVRAAVRGLHLLKFARLGLETEPVPLLLIRLMCRISGLQVVGFRAALSRAFTAPHWWSGSPRVGCRLPMQGCRSAHLSLTDQTHAQGPKPAWLCPHEKPPSHKASRRGPAELPGIRRVSAAPQQAACLRGPRCSVTVHAPSQAAARSDQSANDLHPMRSSQVPRRSSRRPQLQRRQQLPHQLPQLLLPCRRPLARQPLHPWQPLRQPSTGQVSTPPMASATSMASWPLARYVNSRVSCTATMR